MNLFVPTGLYLNPDQAAACNSTWVGKPGRFLNGRGRSEVRMEEGNRWLSLGAAETLARLFQQKQQDPLAMDTEEEKWGDTAGRREKMLHGWRGSRAALELLLVYTLGICHLCSLLAQDRRTTFIQKQLACYCAVW